MRVLASAVAGLLACDAADPPTTPSAGNFSSPEGLVAVGDLVAVANVDFRGTSFGDGSVTVIEAASQSVRNRIPTTLPNPQFLAVTPELLVVVSSGLTAWDAEAGVHTATGSGGVDVFHRATLRTATAPDVHIPLPADPGDPRRGGPGSIAVLPDGRTAYVASGLAAVIAKVDLEDGSVARGMDDPIIVRSHERNETLTLAWHPSGVVLVACFVSGELYRLDPATDTVGAPVTLVAGGDLEGVIDLHVSPGTSPDVLWVSTIANALGAWELDAGAPDPRAAATGVAANRVRVAGGHAYVVNSGENNLQRSPLSNLGAVDRPFAVLPVGSNPWDMAVAGELGFVSLFRANRVAVVDLKTGALLGEIQ